jgi:hypothetical protein
MKRQSKTTRRHPSGSAIAEFGPALGILLICFFFPLVDMLALGVSYGLCLVLNSNQVHEASLLPKSDATNASGVVMKGLVDQWLSGMGHFVNIVTPPQTTVTYRTGELGGDGVQDQIVMVETKVVCGPFLPIPLPVVHVPGLNGDMPFVLRSERQMEDPDNTQR